MGLRDRVAKLEEGKSRREVEKMERENVKLAPREVLAQSIQDVPSPGRFT